MGLKTTNYYIAKFDLTLPNAYAKLRTLVLNSSGKVSATFSIQQSRNHCEAYEPIDVIRFETKATWNRDIPLEEFAYEAVKEEKYEELNDETKQPEMRHEKGPFYGWEDDYA